MQSEPPLDVPTTEVDLTADWLGAALSGVYPRGSVSLRGRERIGETFGLASRLFRCRFEGEPCSVVVKLWATDGPGGTREVPFYSTFGPELDSHVPRCYHGAVDREHKRGVLVLEDLHPFRQGDCLEQLPLERALRLSETLAAVHARWWGRDELLEIDWLPPPRERGSEWFATRRELFLRRFGDRLDGPARELLENVERAPTLANERLADADPTLLHADFHLDNVVFRLPTEHPVLLDWARAVKGPAALDVAELVFSIGQPEDAQRILASYLAALRSRGVTELDESSLRSQLGASLLRKFSTATCGVARWQPASDREAAMIDVGLKRTVRALNDWRARDPSLFAL
jgi:hypothetical protein